MWRKEERYEVGERENKEESDEESESEVAQSCPTLCDPMDCSLPSSSVHGIFQAIVLEWIAISFSRESSQPRDQTQVSHIAERHFTIWATGEVQSDKEGNPKDQMGCTLTWNLISFRSLIWL